MELHHNHKISQQITPSEGDFALEEEGKKRKKQVEQAKDENPKHIEILLRSGSGAINPKTGEFYPGVQGGIINPRTREFMPDVGGGYIDPKNKEVHSKALGKMEAGKRQRRFAKTG